MILLGSSTRSCRQSSGFNSCICNKFLVADNRRSRWKERYGETEYLIRKIMHLLNLIFHRINIWYKTWILKQSTEIWVHNMTNMVPDPEDHHMLAANPGCCWANPGCRPPDSHDFPGRPRPSRIGQVRHRGRRRERCLDNGCSEPHWNYSVSSSIDWKIWLIIKEKFILYH